MATTKRSLREYVKAKRRKDCPVCALPPVLLAQLKEARAKKITRTEALEWLAAEYGIRLTAAQMDTHTSARHEQG